MSGPARGAPSHAPSSRLGACDACSDGDHGSCVGVTDRDDCTCYDDTWEWHETVALPRTATPPRFAP